MKKRICLIFFSVLFLLLFNAYSEIEEPIPYENGIALIRVSGDTYSGCLMIVRDPSRVILGVTNESFTGSGMGIDEFCKAYGAVAAINASGFVDENGRGNGGTPIGMVISEGKILRNSDRKTAIAAFDRDHVLHAGIFTKEEAESLSLRDGAGWGPVLVINGEAQDVTGKRTGLNPRSAIGQRADGAVLLLMLDGRHPNSIGADYGDLIDVMLEYGAVTACNLDGGTSSVLYYKGERVSTIENIAFSRSVPTAFLVMPSSSEDTEYEKNAVPSYTAFIPSDHILSVNGEILTEDTILQRDLPSEHASHIHKDIQNPIHTLYTLYALPENAPEASITLTNAQGENVPYFFDPFVLSVKPTAPGEEYASLSQTALTSTQTFANFFVGKTKLDNALKNVEWKSRAYEILYEYDLWKSAKAGSTEMRSCEVTECTMLGDSCAAIRVQGLFRASYSTENVIDYPLDYTFYFRIHQDKWKIYDFVSR